MPMMELFDKQIQVRIQLGEGGFYLPEAIGEQDCA